MTTMDTVKYVCILILWLSFIISFFMDTKHAIDETRSNISLTPADKASLCNCVKTDFVGVVVCLLGIYLFGK